MKLVNKMILMLKIFNKRKKNHLKKLRNKENQRRIDLKNHHIPMNKMNKKRVMKNLKKNHNKNQLRNKLKKNQVNQKKKFKRNLRNLKNLKILKILMLKLKNKNL